MSTSIEWTHIPGYRGDVWNPTTGCNKVSQGCKHASGNLLDGRTHLEWPKVITEAPANAH